MGVFRRKRGDSAKVYLYVSDSKLDMLFEQIPKSVLKSISAEIEVNLRMVKVKLATAKDAALVRADKLAIVERYIDKTFDVGTLQRVGREYYFRGHMPMRWGFIGSDQTARQAAPAVVFKSSEGQYTLVLAGSRRNVLASVGDLHEIRSATSLPDIAKVLSEYDHDSTSPNNLGDSDQQIFDDAEFLQLSGPTQSVEFLATAWGEGDVQSGNSHRHIVIGSPWYVAVAPREPIPASPSEDTAAQS